MCKEKTGAKIDQDAATANSWIATFQQYDRTGVLSIPTSGRNLTPLVTASPLDGKPNSPSELVVDALWGALAMLVPALIVGGYFDISLGWLLIPLGAVAGGYWRSGY
ncbi:hypothetical protein [Mycolicibacterium sp. HS_4_1]